MRVMRKAVFTVVLIIAATTIEIGCGNVYRPIASPLPTTTGNPSGPETEVVLSCCLDASSPNAVGPNPGSVLTLIDVSGDTNAGNKVLANVAGNGLTPVAASVTPIAFDFARNSVFTANTTTDTATELLLNNSTAGFSANTATISLESGSAPIGISFQYFGSTYAQDYVVNSGTTTATCPGTGSLGVIAQPSALLTATICIEKVAGGITTTANPVFAWIYRDQSKVFVLDNQATGSGNVYVVSASKHAVTNSFAVGAKPTKVAQSNNGSYIYVLNSGDGSISIIDGQAETVVKTISTANALSSSLPIDIAQDTNFNDSTANTQINRVWILHADGTVSVWDGTVPGQLTWITSVATTATVSPTAKPTNLALMRDGTQAYVGVSGMDKIIAINTSALATGAITKNATTVITVGVHRSINGTKGGKNVVLENTTPAVNYVAVSRGGNSSDLSKAYAATTTDTTYFYYDANGNPTSARPADDPTPATCTDAGNATRCPNLYSGTAVVTAAANGSTPINTYVTTIPAPAQVTYCSPGNPATEPYDAQKSCPAMTPVMVLGRS